MMGPIDFVMDAILIASPFAAPRVFNPAELLMIKNEHVNMVISSITWNDRSMVTTVKIMTWLIENAVKNGIKTIKGAKI